MLGNIIKGACVDVRDNGIDVEKADVLGVGEEESQY